MNAVATMEGFVTLAAAQASLYISSVVVVSIGLTGTAVSVCCTKSVLTWMSFLQHPNQSSFAAAEAEDKWPRSLAVLYHTGPHETCSVVDILYCSYASEHAPNTAVYMSHRVSQPALEARRPFLQGAMALDICTMPGYQSGGPSSSFGSA